ncbi:MAG TPA: hypothetical protein GX523_11125 [Desulfitobacterium dehalogenans]|uniref:Uncharacterized protein n=1 Tax=Desulfitobacterium dehalogenans TaxID=36854 RepID=A0A7C6Z524_9FIRM|nr:hypothetical protein [Desulfitobacterium dehalogenans]
MITWDQVIQGMLKRKELLILTVKAVCILSFVWAALFYILLFTNIPYSKLNTVANGIQLFAGLAIGMLVICYARFSFERYLVLGVALAVLSWTLGQLYWFSFIFLDGSSLPYPSIADLGFIGTYFFLIGVIYTITKRIPQYTIKIKYRNLWPLGLLLIPIFLSLVGSNTLLINIDNLALTLAIGYTLWKAQPIFPITRYRLFIAGLCLLCLSDMIFMICICLMPDAYTLSTDALFPAALSLTAYGFMKVEEMSDG